MLSDISGNNQVAERLCRGLSFLKPTTPLQVVWHLLGSNSYMRTSISMSSGHWWRQLRRCVSQAFTSSKLKPLVPDMEVTVDRFLVLLEEESWNGGTEVDMFPLMRRLAFDMVAFATLGVDLDVQRNPNLPIFRESSTFLSGFASQFFNKTAQCLSSVKGLGEVLNRVVDALGWQLLSRIAHCIEPIVIQRGKNPEVSRTEATVKLGIDREEPRYEPG